MAAYFHWRLYCDTEETHVYSWATDAPTECPTDAEHSPVLASIAVVGSCDAEETPPDWCWS